MARPLFSFFLWGGRNKGLVWFTVATRLGTPTVVEGVNGSNVIYYCLIVTPAISVVLLKHVSSHIKSLWIGKRRSFSFNQRFQNRALCTSTRSVKQLPLFNTRYCIKTRRAQAAACIQITFFSKDKYHQQEFIIYIGRRVSNCPFPR